MELAIPSTEQQSDDNGRGVGRIGNLPFDVVMGGEGAGIFSSSLAEGWGRSSNGRPSSARPSGSSRSRETSVPFDFPQAAALERQRDLHRDVSDTQPSIPGSGSANASRSLTFPRCFYFSSGSLSLSALAFVSQSEVDRLRIERSVQASREPSASRRGAVKSREVSTPAESPNEAVDERERNLHWEVCPSHLQRRSSRNGPAAHSPASPQRFFLSFISSEDV